MDLKIVTFLRDWNAYPKGARAGFAPEVAKGLEEAGIAEPAKTEAKTSKPATGAVNKAAKAEDKE